MSARSQRVQTRHRAESEPFLSGTQQCDDDIELGEQDHVTHDDGVNVRGFPRTPFGQNSATTTHPVTNRRHKGIVLPPSSPTDSDNMLVGMKMTPSSTWWKRCRWASARRQSSSNPPRDNLLKGQSAGPCLGRGGKCSQRGGSGFFRMAFRLFVCFLMFLGVGQFLALLIGIATAFFPDHFAALYLSRQDDSGISHWPTDFSADILPVRCHSHNDYWRRVPLFDAISAGCTGVEADVWLYNDELYVGHSESSLTFNRTLRLLYVEPLLDILQKQNPKSEFQPRRNSPRNGVFDTDTQQPLVLLIDFKTNGDALWPVVQKHLEPLRTRQYLTHFNGSVLIPGPIIVVATGNAPFHKVIANSTYRDIFFDAPLPELAKLVPSEAHSSPPMPISLSSPTTPEPYDSAIEKAYLAKLDSHATTSAIITKTGDDTTPRDKGQGYSGALVPSDPKIYTVYNSYYASTSFKATLPISPFPYLSAPQGLVLENQVRGAHMQGLQARYWSVPAWPVSWRHYLWRELLKLGIDYLNVDDLEDATKGDWLSSGSVGKAIWGVGGW